MAYEAKTKPTASSVEAFIASVDNDRRRADAETTLNLYKRVTGMEPVMWGPAIVGFGESVFTYEKTGTKSRVPAACFSPRKAGMALYLGDQFEGAHELYARLGKYKMGVACVTVNKLDDIDLDVLAEIVARSTAASLERAKS